MPYNKLLTVVTMMLLAGSKLGAQQAVSVDDLRQIERLITQKDCGQLYSFLVSKPQTIAGTDTLARELQLFVRDVQRGNLECFGASVASRNIAEASVPTTRTAASVASDRRIY